MRIAVEPGDGIAITLDSGFGLTAEFLAGIEKGVRSAVESGPVAGFPLIDLRVTVLEAGTAGAGSPLGFEIASRAALGKAVRAAGAHMLEPVMAVEVIAPIKDGPAVCADLETRRGVVAGRAQDGPDCVIVGLVPLSMLFGYLNNLRAMTGGRGRFSSSYAHHAPVPQWHDGDDDDFPGRWHCADESGR